MRRLASGKPSGCFKMSTNLQFSLHVLFPQELEHMQCYNQRMIENLKSRQQQERSRLPKIQRTEAKTRLAIFKKSIRINSTFSTAEERERIKQVEERSNISHVLSFFLAFLTCSSSTSFLCRRRSDRRRRGKCSNRNTTAR